MPMTEESKGQFVTHSEFSQFAQSTRERFDQTDSRMREILTAVNDIRSIATRPTNYGLLIAGLTALGSFILLYTNPINERAQRNTERIEEVRNSRFTAEDGDALSERIDAWHDELVKHRIEQAYWQGKADTRIEQLEKEGTP